MKNALVLLALVCSSVQAADYKHVEKFVNSFYDCGKITKHESTQWTEHQTGLVVHCANQKRYVLLKAGPNRHQVIPIYGKPRTAEEQARRDRLLQSLYAPRPIPE